MEWIDKLVNQTLENSKKWLCLFFFEHKQVQFRDDKEAYKKKVRTLTRKSIGDLWLSGLFDSLIGWKNPTGFECSKAIIFLYQYILMFLKFVKKSH